MQHCYRWLLCSTQRQSLRASSTGGGAQGIGRFRPSQSGRHARESAGGQDAADYRLSESGHRMMGRESQQQAQLDEGHDPQRLSQLGRYCMSASGRRVMMSDQGAVPADARLSDSGYRLISGSGAQPAARASDRCTSGSGKGGSDSGARVSGRGTSGGGGPAASSASGQAACVPLAAVRQMQRWASAGANGTGQHAMAAAALAAATPQPHYPQPHTSARSSNGSKLPPLHNSAAAAAARMRHLPAFPTDLPYAPRAVWGAPEEAAAPVHAEAHDRKSAGGRSHGLPPKPPVQQASGCQGLPVGSLADLPAVGGPRNAHDTADNCSLAATQGTRLLPGGEGPSRRRTAPGNGGEWLEQIDPQDAVRGWMAAAAAERR
jgi:hypothetical protein